LAVWADRVSVEALDFEPDSCVLERELSDDLADAVGDQLSLKKLQDLLAAQMLHDDVEIAPGFALCSLGQPNLDARRGDPGARGWTRR
jgi:hypothetical protein